jgi:hypothetical protein
MKHCPACGHHHGAGNNHWPSCQAITEYDDAGGIQRCHCTSPHPTQ